MSYITVPRQAGGASPATGGARSAAPAAAVQEGVPGGEAALTSYSAHNSHRPVYRAILRVKRFPDQGRTAVCVPMPTVKGARRLSAIAEATALQGEEAVALYCPTRSESDPLPPSVQERSLVRSQVRIKETARASRLVRMATLTFPEAVRDYDKAYRLISGWLHREGRQWFPDYVAVPELHPGGHGWHWHVLHRKRLDPRELFAFRESWTRYLLSRGYVLPHGSAYARVHLKHFSHPRRAASYAAKYVGKTLGQGLTPGRQRYLRSEGLDVPEVREFAVRCLDDCASALRQAGWTVIDGREKGWGTFVWATTDPPFDSST